MTDRYQILRLITKDPMGGIYLALDTELEREVAFRHFDLGFEPIDPELWQPMFSGYGGRLCSVKHPNLRNVYEAVIDEDDAILISEYVEAETISTILKTTGRFDVLETVAMAENLLSAIKAAHAEGIYHGAMHTGSVKQVAHPEQAHQYIINDLGIKYLALLVKGEETHPEDPGLIPPEYHNEPFNPTAQGDLFMIGQLCYTVLAGGHPFANHTPEQCAKAYRARKIPSLRKFNSDVPKGLTAWIMQMIAGPLNIRFSTADEALAALKKINLATLPPATKAQPPTNSPSAKSDTKQEESTPDIALTTPPTYTKPKTNKPKRYTILGILLGLPALALILWYGPMQGGAGKSSSPQASDSQVSTADTASDSDTDITAPVSSGNPPSKAKKTNSLKVTLGKTALINPMSNRKKPKTINIDTPSTLDWVIATSTPAANSLKQKENGRYILNTKPKGNFLEFKFRSNPVHFTADNKKLIPRAATGKRHHAKLGQGWTTMFRPPANHKGPLRIIYYITQWNCDLSFEIKNHSSNKTSQLQFPATTAGVFSIPIDIPNAKPGEFFSITVTAISEHPKKGFTIGLNGIQISNSTQPTNQQASTPINKTPAQKKLPKPPPPKIKTKTKTTASPPPPAKPRQSKKFLPALQTFTSNNHFPSKDWFNAEGSIIKVGENKYCLFYSRWEKQKSVHARITHSEIALATSNSSSGPWTHRKTILKGRSGKWDQFGVNQPTVKMFDGKYYLYYVSTSADITNRQLESASKIGSKDPSWTKLNQNRCIGIARANSYKGPWKRLDAPIITAKSPYKHFSCSPSVTQLPNKQFLMMVCSMSDKGNIVSYITKSKTPHFDKHAVQAQLPGESFSLWYNPSNKYYQYLYNGDGDNFFSHHSSKLKSKYDNNKNKYSLPKPIGLPPLSPVPTTSFQSPNIFLDDGSTPEVFIFHSDDSTNGGIFTIPLKK